MPLLLLYYYSDWLPSEKNSFNPILRMYLPAEEVEHGWGSPDLLKSAIEEQKRQATRAYNEKIKG